MLALALAGSAHAQTPKASAPAPVPATAAFHVEGFRSARFGMTPDQVRMAVTKDFSLPAAAISQTDNALEHTTVLIVKVDKLEPGPGPAMVSYIFGATKKTLMHINVAWTVAGQPTDEQRRTVTAGAVQLTAYFQNQAWPPKRTTGGVMTQPGKVLLFGGIDDKGAGVEVVVTGVPVEAADPKAAKPTPSTGPAQLLVSYSADVQHPDVFALKPGAF